MYDFVNFNQGGYNISGPAYSGSMAMVSTNDTVYEETTIMVVTDVISENTWLYDVDLLSSGIAAFGPNSFFIYSTNENYMQWLIEIGNVANQSFAGGNYEPASTPSLFIGDGDYSTLWMGNYSNSVTLTASNETGFSLNLTSISFG